MGLDFKTLAASKKYTEETAEGMGAVKGKDGKDGESAYQIALENGFVGSQAQWLESLKGKNGQDGTDGLDGNDGFSPIIIPSNDNTDDIYKLNITTAKGTFSTDNLKGKQGVQGIQGIRGEKGEQGTQGIQGIQGERGEKGHDGYPFLIYKEYETIDEFQSSDFPEIGLMFMVKTQDEFNAFPVYRYTGEEDAPYSYITGLSAGEAIKGEKGDKGDTGIQGLPGLDGKDGTTYVPAIGTVVSGINPNATVVINEDTKEAEFSFTLPKGNKGDKGETGDKGDKGQDGADGKDGGTPYIKNGTWWYGDTDSGVPIPSFLDLLKYVDETYGIQDTPIGHILTHMGNNAPKHYLKCDGTVYNIGTYPYLEEHFKKEFGKVNYFGGDGVNTFAVPDLRGEFLRGTGTAERDTGSGADVGKHQNATSTMDAIVEASSGRVIFPYANNANILGSNFDKEVAVIINGNSYFSPSNKVTSIYASVKSIRPTNTSVLYCIKYEPTYFMIINGEA